MTKKRTTLKDIAEKLGISVATVSRALKNHPEISQRIKDQVNLLVASMNYRPNSFALHLKNQQSKMIGVILPKIVHYHSSTILKGIISKCHDLNYQVLICESGVDADSERENASSLINTGIDGLLVSLSNNNFSEDFFGELHADGLPMVFFDKVPTTISSHKVLTNDYTGAFIATEHLIKNNYKKIAHYKGQKGARNTQPRYNGYMAAIEKYGIELNPKFIIECLNCNEEEGYKQTIALFKEAEKPDAIFCVNDEMAIGALSALRHLNIKVPEEVGVVGFSNSTASKYMYPSLTSIEQSGEEIGKTAADLLIQNINHDENIKATFVQNVIEPILIIRESSNRSN
jgi:LacI family transcriptional regulator